jgi:hypothetical protein
VQSFIIPLPGETLSFSMRQRQVIKVTGLVLLGIGAVAVLGTLLLRDQIARHKRDLFSAHPLRRLAALSFLASSKEATIDAVQLLRDFVAIEPRPMLRRRAQKILLRMERRVEDGPGPHPSPGEVAG